VRNLVVALSLANLLFLRAWEKSRVGSFLDDFKPDGISIIFCVLVTAAILWIAWHLVRSHPRLSAAAKIIFLLLLPVPLNALRLYYNQSFVPIYGDRHGWIRWIVLALFALPIVVALVRRRFSRQFLVRYGLTLILMLAPFAFFTFGGSLLTAYRVRRAERRQMANNSSPANAAAPGKDRGQSSGKRPRVVWIVFDEMDNRVAFKERPASVSLPEFDRFRSESFVALAAHPPGAETARSIPALLNGGMVTEAQPRGETSLVIWGENKNQPVIWNVGMSIFAETAASEIGTGLAGVFFPYCAILGGNVTDCRDLRSFRAHEGFPKRVYRDILLALDAIPLADRLWLRTQLRNQIEEYQFAVREGSSLAADARFDLVFIHFPVPHPPAIYDRRSAHLDIASKHSYLDNLALADVALGILRRAMEQSGEWTESNVIVTSDHWWRTYFWNSGPYWSREDQSTSGGRMPEDIVPFMVKLSGSSDRMLYERPFNTVISRKLVMAILKKGVPTNADLTRWLDQNAVGRVEPIWTPPSRPTGNQN
jgi:hypothetical protein